MSLSKAAEERKTAQEIKAAEAKAPSLSEDAEYAKLLAEWQPMFQAAVMDYTNAVTRGVILQLRRRYLYDSIARGGFAAEFPQTTKEIENNKEEVATAEKMIEALKVGARAAGVKEGDIAAMVGELPKPTITDLKTLEPQMPPNPPPPGVYAPIG